MNTFPTNIQASVIIPTYNRADIIIRSLETWTRQGLPDKDYEVIVVDNNSTDTTEDILQKFISGYPNFKYLKELNQGSTNARHAGAKLAQSNILIFADDDGLFNENCILEILKVYQSNPVIAAVAGKIDILWDKTPPEWILPYEFMLGKLRYGNEVIIGHDLYLNGGLFSIRKEIFDELEGFNPDLIGNYLVGDGDTGLVLKLHKENKLIGWTPFAQMQHLQFVDKQGTKQDLGRRFYNIGISHSYGVFRLNNFKWNKNVFLHISKSVLHLSKKFTEYSIFGRKDRKIFFSYMQRKGELVFFYNSCMVKLGKNIK